MRLQNNQNNFEMSPFYYTVIPDVYGGVILELVRAVEDAAPVVGADHGELAVLAEVGRRDELRGTVHLVPQRNLQIGHENCKQGITSKTQTLKKTTPLIDRHQLTTETIFEMKVEVLFGA